jgi:Tol biopolymer transport system component
VFATDQGAGQDLYEKASNGQGDQKLLFKSDEVKAPLSWSRDGRYILFSSRNAEGNWNLFALPTFGDRKPLPVVTSPFMEPAGAFSPDGRFVAYQSNESGRWEIYVQSFPNAAGKWQVSNTGGLDVSWSADGRQLTYRALDQKLMAVDVQAGEVFAAGIPRQLFLASVMPGTSRNKYAVSADGKRFLFVAPLGRDALVPTTVVMNWNAELGR